MTSAVYFYPTTSGNGTATANINKAFGSVGSGRLEVINSSPRCQSDTHQVYMTIEHIAGVAIEAPLRFALRNANPDHEVVLLKTLEFSNAMVQNMEFDFLLGGFRTSGYGRAKVLLSKEKKTKKTKNGKNGKSRGKNLSLMPSDNEPEESEEPEEEGEEVEKGYKIQFSLTKAEAEDLEQKFAKIVAQESARFSIPWNPEKEGIKQEQKEA
jgi:hypothetical protein